MIGYITLGTSDIKGGFIAWGKPGDKAGLSIIKPYDGKAMSVGNGSMTALQAKDEAHVKRIYDLAISLGGTCEGAYFRDLDGHKLNAFCMGTPTS